MAAVRPLVHLVVDDDERQRFEETLAAMYARRQPSPFDDPEWRRRDEERWLNHPWLLGNLRRSLPRRPAEKDITDTEREGG